MSEINDKQVAKPKVRWVQTLDGRWSTQTYGIVEFLRVHSLYRGLVAVLGVAICITTIATIGQIHILGLNLTPSFVFVGIIVGPWLLFVATIAGPHFEVTFPPRQAAQERENAERRFEESETVENALKLDLTKLNEYYDINQSQARSSFRWAVFSMMLGFGTIISGIWLFYFRGGQPDIFMASLSTAAGCVVNLVSGLFLYLHSKIQAHSLHYFDRLSRLQALSIAIRLGESHEDETARQGARNLVIRELVSNVRSPPQNKTEPPITTTEQYERGD